MSVVILFFSFFVFGITGIRLVLGIILVSIPFYFILKNFRLTDSELFTFSLLLGLTIFPSLVYLLGFFVSFKLAIAFLFLFFILIALALWKYKKKNTKN